MLEIAHKQGGGVKKKFADVINGSPLGHAQMPVVRQHTTLVPQVPLHGMHTSPLLSSSKVCTCTTFSGGLSFLPLETVVAPSAIQTTAQMPLVANRDYAPPVSLYKSSLSYIPWTFHIDKLGDCTIEVCECHFLFVVYKTAGRPTEQAARLCCN